MLRRSKVYTTPTGKRERLDCEGGLHYLKGNRSPYFSLIATVYEWRRGRWHDFGGGCMHKEIVRRWPDLAPLAALHLSDIDGRPMHAEANGYYWLAGACGGLQQQFHGGNSRPARSEAECLEIFARHCRITIEEAERIKARVLAAFEANPKRAPEVWAEECDAMAPRWRDEAAAAIEQLKLTVYGDEWKGAA